ncbi:helicase [Bifidobacterium sp.]|jgi:hypothetical protein|uniref:helicase n=1 Tax=Bifidobacterium sp. TaxID=41200 RepID=UPI0025C4F047|nr:helicase [Bifidobacterium sp.]MCH4209041.1 helicase [Bifidobacterium sp.]MCI1225588.1 helicase [Bifidobacterium sp.]
MSESSAATRSVPGLDRLRRWREEYRRSLKPSPLEDVNQLTAQLDMTHAHPSGIAQLFASGQAALDALFRDAGMLRAAGRRLERVMDDQSAKMRISGLAPLSLIVGVAKWKGNGVPVLMYPVEVNRKKNGRETDATIRFTGHVRLNPDFVAALREQGVDLDEAALFDGANYESGTPETSAVFEAITAEAVGAFPDFDIERDIILGCFLDPAAQILLESRSIIAALEHGGSGNAALDALAGDADAAASLKGEAPLSYSPFDGDPHSEFEIGDVDNTVRYAANMAAVGNSLFVDVSAGCDTAQESAAIASRCVMNGRSVLYAPCVGEQKRRFMAAVNASGLGGLVLDATDEHINRSIDRQLIEAVGFQPGVDSTRFDQLSDELVGVRSRLARYLGDLHGVNEQWGVSAYQTIQNLATIAVLPTHPTTHVRLSKTSAHAVGEHMDEWNDRLKRAGELGEYTIGPQDTAWYAASIMSEDEAVKAYQRASDVLRKLLPVTRDQVASTVQTCGFPIPATAREWSRQVMVLRNLRRVLDVFQSEIFERDIDAMIEASKPKALRKAEGTSMGFWERRRHIKEAKSLLRVGAQVEDLHEALKVVARQAEQWRLFVPHGGWPVLPARLDAILETQEALMDSLTALDAVLASTPQGANLEALGFQSLEERLKALYDDRMALDTLPGRCVLEQEFGRVGLSELVEDLRNRHVDIDAVEGELQLSWWTTVFEDIVRSSAIISNQDGSALQAAADRFAQVDAEHVRSIGPMVRQEMMRRLCDLLFSRTQEANQLHTVLAGSTSMPLSRIRRDHPQILAAAKPIIVATPPTLAAMSEPAPLCDVAIIDAGAHLPSAQLLSIVSRAQQVVVLAHKDTVTSEALAALIDMLPAIATVARPVRRHPALTAFLQEQGYGDMRVDVTTEPMQGHIGFHRIDAVGVPVLSSGLVESSQQEIDEVIRIITQRAAGFTVVPAGYVLGVVTLTAVFRTRLGAELKSLAAKNSAMGKFLRHVRLMGINEVTGAHANDVVISLCYAKTSHGRLLQQFGYLEGEGGKGMLLDALALADRDVDIVSAFGSQDLDDERLHQKGPRLLKTMLQWVEHRTDDPTQLKSVTGFNGSTQSNNTVRSGDMRRANDTALSVGTAQPSAEAAAATDTARHADPDHSTDSARPSGDTRWTSPVRLAGAVRPSDTGEHVPGAAQVGADQPGAVRPGAVRPEARQSADNVLFNDLAERIRARGLDVAVDYGFERGLHIPLVIGLKGRPFALAVLTDDAQFMGIQSTRRRHRVLMQDLESLGWSVMSVWSVGAFVNPDREVDRIVERISAIYGEHR